MVAFLVAVLHGCASLIEEDPNQAAQAMEPMLEAAGFTRIPANTPEKLQQLKAMKPLRLMKRRGQDGRVQYIYADPYYCQCVFVGDWAAYQAVRRDLAQQDVVREEQYQGMMDDDVEPDTSFDPLSDPFGPYEF
jgi:hypothetical protein